MNIFSDTTLAFARTGETLFRGRQIREAVEVLVEGVKLHPSHVTGFLVLAKIHRESGRIFEAATEFENALRLDPRCPAALKALAEIAEESGDHALEAQYLGRLLGQEPWDEQYQSSHRRSRALASPIPKSAAAPEPSEMRPKIAVAPKVEGGLAEDEEIAEEFEEEAVPNVATITLAEIYFQQGLKEQALLIYRQVSDSQPDNETVRKRLGEIEASLGSSKPEGS